MEIVNFTSAHIPDAMQLALNNYREECVHVPALPFITETPNLTSYAANGLGVAALQNGKLIGFLCCHSPHEHVFHSQARGVFSPIHAHGAQSENRDVIYQRLYEAAARKWLEAGISYHSLGLYAHDTAALHTFFWNGFGLRCLDGICSLSDHACLTTQAYTPGVHDRTGITMRELLPEEAPLLRPLRQALHAHLAQSPCFMNFPPEELRAEIAALEACPPRSFAAFTNDRLIAYYDLAEEAETFISARPEMQNICGAFCLPTYRGQGLAANLLAYMRCTLASEGYTHLGVDCESFNPTAAHFWPRHFSIYTHGVTRRVDECALPS